MPKCSYHAGKVGPIPTRIFEISLGRTGTRSICQAVSQLGISYRHGTRGCDDCQEDAIRKYLTGSWDFDYYQTADMVSNLSCVHWERLYSENQRNLFILPIRPLRTWLQSWEKLRRVGPRYLNLCRAYPIGWGCLHQLHFFGQLTFNRIIWEKVYLEHRKKIEETIHRDRLLILDVFNQSSEKLWSELIEFFVRHRILKNQDYSSFIRQPFPKINHGKYPNGINLCRNSK